MFAFVSLSIIPIVRRARVKCFMLEKVTKEGLKESNLYEIPEELLSIEEGFFAKSEAFENRESKKDEICFIIFLTHLLIEI